MEISDDYIFCTGCAEYVYEYCSIHGGLLVVPDDEVAAKTNLSSSIPHAALTIPEVFLHLAPSVISDAGIGVFTTLTLPRNIRFGPYRGRRATGISSDYCWQIYDVNNKPSHVIDAADGGISNWMRFVNCARHWREQNLVAFQYRGEMYYRTIKTILPFTELLVFYGSEFAIDLGIALRKYNLHNGYLQLFGEICTNQKAASFAQVTKFTNVNWTSVDAQTDKKYPEISGSEDSNELIHNYHASETENDVNKEINTNNSLYKNDNSQLMPQNELTNFFKDKFYFLCKKCDYKSVTAESLQKHLRVHDETRAYTCKVCGYRFKKKDILAKHLNIHTHEKLYACSHCGRRFTAKRNLNTHIKTHNSEKPHKCPYCEYKTIKKSNLYMHIKTHTV